MASRQSDETVVVFAARAALRVVPVTLSSAVSRDRLARQMILRVFLASAAAWANAAFPAHREKLRRCEHCCPG
jgi:hypothetical protein